MASIYISNEEIDNGFSHVNVSIEGEAETIMTMITDLIVAHASNIGVDPCLYATAIASGVKYFGEEIQKGMGLTDGCS